MTASTSSIPVISAVNPNIDGYWEPVSLEYSSIFDGKINDSLPPDVGETYDNRQPSLKNDGHKNYKINLI
jgi:hypothetical protein